MAQAEYFKHLTAVNGNEDHDTAYQYLIKIQLQLFQHISFQNFHNLPVDSFCLKDSSPSSVL